MAECHQDRGMSHLTCQSIERVRITLRIGSIILYERTFVSSQNSGVNSTGLQAFHTSGVSQDLCCFMNVYESCHVFGQTTRMKQNPRFSLELV